MSRIIAEVIASGKMSLRSKVGVFFTLIFPVLLVLLFGAIFSEQGTSAITLEVQNLDDGPMSEVLLTILDETQLVKMHPISIEEDITEYIKDNSLSVALLIPEGFSDDVQQSIMNNYSGSAQVILYGDFASQSFGISQTALDAATTRMNYNLSQTSPIITAIPSELPLDKKFGFIEFFLPGIIGFTIMTTGLFGMTAQCAEYRSRGFFKLLATTTLRKSDWLIANFIIYTGLVTVALLLTMAVGIAAYDLSATLTPLVFAFIIVGVLLFTGLGMLIGTVIKDPESGSAIANAIGFPMMFLSGIFFPIEMFPPYLQTVAHFLPLTYLANGLRDTMIFDNTSGALPDLAILIVIAVIFVVLASKVMSWKEK